MEDRRNAVSVARSGGEEGQNVGCAEEQVEKTNPVKRSQTKYPRFIAYALKTVREVCQPRTVEDEWRFGREDSLYRLPDLLKRYARRANVYSRPHRHSRHIYQLSGLFILSDGQKVSLYSLLERSARKGTHSCRQQEGPTRVAMIPVEKDRHVDVDDVVVV